MKKSLNFLGLAALFATSGAWGASPIAGASASPRPGRVLQIQDTSRTDGEHLRSDEESEHDSRRDAERSWTERGGFRDQRDRTGRGGRFEERADTQEERAGGFDSRERTGRGWRADRPTAFVGIVTSPLDGALSAQLGLTDGQGLMVERVLPNTPAAKAGLQRFDVIRRVNDQLIFNPAQLAGLIRHYGKGANLTLGVLRKGQEQTIALTVGEQEATGTGGAFPAPDTGRRPDSTKEQMEERMRERRARELNERGTSQRGGTDAPGATSERAGTPDRETDRTQTSVITPVTPESTATPNLSTTLPNAASAEVAIKDESGEMNIRVENGQRTLVAKDPNGQVVFSGPIDTPEQRQAVPETFRRKLDRVQVEGGATGVVPAPGSPNPEGTSPSPTSPPAAGQ